MGRSNFLKEKRKVDARVDWMVKNKIQHFQPTISPAPKNMERGEIESVEEAMKYFAPYSSKLVLQTKYMGSYCCMYLNRDHSKSYFVSRNGYVIKRVEGLHKASEKIHKEVFNRYKYQNIYEAEWILVESELMPWIAMGKGLIEEEYGNYGRLHRQRLETFKNTGLLYKLENLKEKTPWLKEDLKPHEKRQYESIQNIDIPDLDVYTENVELFENQLNNFSKEDEVHFKPFNILKVVYEEGEEYFPEENSEYIGDVNDFIIIRNNDYETAYEFFNRHTNANLEGIMVKPLKQHLINIAPCLKVRNNNYLQLIYGVNFNRDFEYYLQKRNIRRKLASSIKGYETTIQMLRTPYSKIEDNSRYKNLLYSAIDSEKFNKTLDTRL